MPSYVPPKKNTALIFYLGLVDQANRPQFKANPTLAAGDFKVSIDGGTLNNLATLPTLSPASSRLVKVSLSAAEMNGDNIIVQCVDAAGDEWDEVLVTLPTSVRQVDDLAFPNTTGRGMDVDATGGVEITPSQVQVKKNTALTGFVFVMYDSADHFTPKTGLTVTATRSLDGAAFGACANAVAEVANGMYKIDLAAGDLNGNNIMLKFTATGADTTFVQLITQA